LSFDLAEFRAQRFTSLDLRISVRRPARNRQKTYCRHASDDQEVRNLHDF
jgi:hypothetical protein